jgi:signal transduction histidine kinase/putative methionine-R-sulfoxide reductase with GAF domain
VVGTQEDRSGSGRERDRSVAQLDMLHSLGARLNSLRDVQEIGEAITEELRTIIDYHNSRVYVLQRDGVTLLPVAFRGELLTLYEGEQLDELLTVVGEGITGHVAETRESLLTPDARQVSFGVTIPGTEDDLLESMLAVPMLAGDRVVGVIVLSSLGYGMFDEVDQRMLEVLASHAGVAIDNASLLQAEREAAETSEALLGLSQALTGRRRIAEIFREAAETIATIVSCDAVGVYLRDEETGDFRVVRVLEVHEGVTRPRETILDIPAELAAPYLLPSTEPFVVPVDVVSSIPSDLHLVEEPREVLVVPLRWEPEAMGALVLIAPSGDARFSDVAHRVARGVADIASLALGNARRLSELERFHELVATLDAAFWEAETPDLRLTFVGGRTDGVLDPTASSWPAQGRRWGDHILEADRDAALIGSRRAIADLQDTTLEYRVRLPSGRTVWVRDLIHVVRGPQGPRQLRGLMVDITERRLAEEALQASERQYSEAFRREREAAQGLRALDEMKNTFLEAVSHDLRTPLTSILGSALTLEQAYLQLPEEDTLDLVRRIASNARKLERLLGDLLDLDRLQRGIISPQRRPTDLSELVQRVLLETENPHGRSIEVIVEPIKANLDASKVERILENLLSNALRHTTPDTRTWVKASRQDGGVLLTVEDDGVGIPEGLREAVFEPFRQAPGSAAGHAPGVGVGLSLVKRFAELHGGRAWAEERDGGGASFSVFLPGA